MQSVQATGSNGFRKFLHFFRYAKRKNSAVTIGKRQNYTPGKYLREIRDRTMLPEIRQDAIKPDMSQSTQLLVHCAGFERFSLPAGTAPTVNYALGPD